MCCNATVPDYTSSLNKALNGSGVSKQLGSTQSESLQQCSDEPQETLQNCGKAPTIAGISSWLNTAGDTAITPADLTGKVVLVDFWAYSCINCQRAIPHVEAWYSAYQADGFEVIGVHTPEYAFEHVASNVASGVKRLKITYPVALDNNYTTWNNFGNDSWPADYLIDATGQIRHVAIGEGDYGTNESLIRELLNQAHPTETLPPATDVPDTTPANPDQTPETYLGSQREQGYIGGALKDGTSDYTYPKSLPDNEFGLSGSWTVGDESITSGAGAGIELDYLASDVYLDVGGTGTITATVDGKTTSYAVSGAPDIYTLVSTANPRDDTVTVTLTPGLMAYSFTFG